MIRLFPGLFAKLCAGAWPAYRAVATGAAAATLALSPAVIAAFQALAELLGVVAFQCHLDHEAQARPALPVTARGQIRREHRDAQRKVNAELRD